MRSWTHKLFAPAGLTASVGASAGALLAGRSIGFVRGVVLAWLLSQRAFGLFHVAVAVVNLLVPLSSLGLTHGVLRYAPAHEVAGTLGPFARRVGLLVLVIAAAVGGVLLFAPSSITESIFAAGAGIDVIASTSPASDAAPTGAAPRGLVVTAVACTFSLVLFHLVLDLMKGLRLFRAAAAMDVLGVFLFSSLAVGAPSAGFDSADAVLLAYGLGNVLAVLVFWPPLIRYLRAQRSDSAGRPSKPLIDAKLIRFSFWIAISQVAWHGLQQYVFWHLAMVSGNAVAAVYFAVRLFAQLVLLGAQTLSRAFSANVTRTWEATGRAAALARLEAGGKVGLLAVFAGAVLMAFLKPWILKAFPSDYAPGSSCFDALVLAYAWFGALEFLLIRFHLEEQSVWTFVTSVTGAIANVVLACAVLGRPGDAAAVGVVEMLPRAGWVCAAGSGLSVLACLTVLTLTGKRPSVWTVLLIVGMGGLGVGWAWGAGLLALAVAAAVGRVGVFTSGERALIAGWRHGR